MCRLTSTVLDLHICSRGFFIQSSVVLEVHSFLYLQFTLRCLPGGGGVFSEAYSYFSNPRK